MIDFIKVFWHCMFNMHRRCVVIVEAVDGRDVFHFCECGYNNNGRTWHEEFPND